MTDHPLLARYRTRSRSRRKLIGAVLLGFFLMLALGAAVVAVAITLHKRSSVPATGEPAFSLSGVDLFQEFQSNEIAANRSYKGQWVEVSGIVEEINEKTLFLRIAYGSEAPQAPSIICRLDRAAHDDFLSFQRGQSVAVVGKCLGTDTYQGVPGYGEMVVILEDCRPGDLGRITKEVRRRDAQKQQKQKRP